MHVPHLADVEVAQALGGYTKDGDLDPATAALLLEDLRALDLQRHAHEPLLDRVWELRQNLSAYDAVYVALAEVLDTRLLTCDGLCLRGRQAWGVTWSSSNRRRECESQVVPTKCPLTVSGLAMIAFEQMLSYLHGHSALSRASSRHSRGKGWLTGGDPDPGHGSAHLLVRRAVAGSPGVAARRTGPWRPRGRNDGHAAASTDGQVAHDADRLASTRARRAAVARDVRSAGIASPVPKYISSGVCPRNAECGSTRLCSST